MALHGILADALAPHGDSFVTMETTQTEGAQPWDLELTGTTAEDPVTARMSSNLNDVTSPLNLFYIIVLILTTVIGNVGNVMVIGAVLTDRRLRKESNLFILNLALADLCVTSFVDPFSLAGVLMGHEWFLQRSGLCHVIGSICLVSCVCSLWSIAAISVNRFILLCHQSLYGRIFSWRSSILIALGLWAVALCLDLPNFFDWGDHTYDMKTMACSYDRTESYSYTVFFITLFVTIPLITVLYCNINIYSFVLKSKIRVSSHSHSHSHTTDGLSQKEDSMSVGSVTETVTMSPPRNLSPVAMGNNTTNAPSPQTKEAFTERSPDQTVPMANLKVTFSKDTKDNSSKVKRVGRGGLRKPDLRREFRLAKTLFIVFMVFCVSWAPYALVCLIDRHDQVSKDVYTVAILMAHSSSTLNSILYAATNKGFRDGYRLFLHSCGCKWI